MPGLLSRLFGNSSLRTAGAQSNEVNLYAGDEPLEVVGESRYQDALWRIVGGRRREPVRYETKAVLEPERDNTYDPNAIKVLIDGALVGYLSREDAASYRPGLLRLMESSPTGCVALAAAIVGGGPRSNGIGFLGVFLDHDPADFELAPQDAASGRILRSGLSVAMTTNLEDDSYDLSWYEKLSENDMTAIKQLRSMLETECDAIDRHYMLSELEKRLYKSRHTLAAALDEFDAVCRQHGEEMVTIRPALFKKFGVIPVIDMYRQAAVRCQKAKDWQAMQDWAEKGISVYGQQAARAEAVEDLHERLAYATAKIEAAVRPKRKPRATMTTSATGAQATDEVETLVCTSCGTSFDRIRTRGRKPLNCPACR